MVTKKYDKKGKATLDLYGIFSYRRNRRWEVDHQHPQRMAVPLNEVAQLITTNGN